MAPLVLANLFVALALSPFLLSIINRTKAMFAGRRGQPLVQPYLDLWKLLHKGAVYSTTTTWFFRAGPVIGLACVLVALIMVPLGGGQAGVSFPGDLVAVAYVLALMRFATVVAAMDTGSSFEGMGASREVQFSALVEPALLLGLAALGRQTHRASLASIYQGLSYDTWTGSGPILVLVVGALCVVFLCENARIPVDDPNTHLELTMIHEVMVLDHGGVDLAFILYSASLKMWLLGSLIVGLVLPYHVTPLWLGIPILVVGLMILAIVTGIVESTMARLRLERVPQLLVGAGVLAVVAVVLSLR